MIYIIRKKTKNTNKPYSGISCDNTKVEPGKFYSTYKEAKKDCDKLNKINSVGFEVIKILS